jgi:hypothetical protein
MGRSCSWAPLAPAHRSIRDRGSSPNFCSVNITNDNERASGGLSYWLARQGIRSGASSSPVSSGESVVDGGSPTGPHRKWSAVPLGADALQAILLA